MIAPRVFDAVPNRQPHDEVEDDDRDDPHEENERFFAALREVVQQAKVTA